MLHGGFLAYERDRDVFRRDGNNLVFVYGDALVCPVAWIVHACDRDRNGLDARNIAVDGGADSLRYQVLSRSVFLLGPFADDIFYDLFIVRWQGFFVIDSKVDANEVGNALDEAELDLLQEAAYVASLAAVVSVALNACGLAVPNLLCDEILDGVGACAVVENCLSVLIGGVNVLGAKSDRNEHHERMGGDSADSLVLRVFLEGDAVRDVFFQVGRHSVGSRQAVESRRLYALS